jgi:hypothetical protein
MSADGRRPSVEVRKIESQRRVRMAFQAAFVLVLGAALGAKVGMFYAAALVLALLLAIFGIIYAILGYDQRREKMRRAAGAAPSWPAAVPKSVLRAALNVGGLHSAASDYSTVAGRLTYLAPGLRWEPAGRSARSHLSASEILWDNSWSVSVQPIWGTGKQGRLTLVHSDGDVVVMWIRYARDVQRVLKVRRSR